jgi:hypothetical protein
VIGDPPPWRKEPKKEEPSVPAEVGATTVPTDINVWGNTAGHAPQPSPTTSDAPPQEPFSAGDAGIVVAETLGEIALDIARGLVLQALTFGGYGSYQMGKAMWEGYQEDGLPGALNAVNPLYWIGRGAADTYIAAEKGDYRAATAAGVKTAVVLGATVATAAQGVGALGRVTGAARGASAGAARGAPRNAHLAGKTHPKTGVPFDKAGYPDFNAVGVVKVEVKISPTGSRPGDFRAANKAAGFPETPKGYTWHHHQDGTTMQLVPHGIHAETGHTGGFSHYK